MLRDALLRWGGICDGVKERHLSSLLLGGMVLGVEVLLRPFDSGDEVVVTLKSTVKRQKKSIRDTADKLEK